MDREQPPPVDRTLPVDPLELWRSGKARTPTTAQRSNSQPFAPLTPARGDDPATAGRTHTLAETVGLGSLAPVRLISALHGTPLRDLPS